MATSLSANIDDEMLYDYGGATGPSLLQHAGSNTAARPPPPPGARPTQVRQMVKADALTIHPKVTHDWSNGAAAGFSNAIETCTACLPRWVASDLPSSLQLTSTSGVVTSSQHWMMLFKAHHHGAWWCSHWPHTAGRQTLMCPLQVPNGRVAAPAGSAAPQLAPQQQRPQGSLGGAAAAAASADDGQLGDVPKLSPAFEVRSA